MCLTADTHLGDKGVQTLFAAQFLQVGVLSHLPAAHYAHDAEPDALYSALLDALRMRLVQVCPSVVLTQAPPHELILLYAILQYAGERNPNTYRWLLYAPPEFPDVCLLPRFVHRLVHNIWAGYYASANADLLDDSAGSTGPALPLPNATAQPSTGKRLSEQCLLVVLREYALSLLFEVLCLVRLRQSEMTALTMHFIDHLFDVVEIAREADDESLSIQVTQLLLAMNEQFMIASQQTSSTEPFGVLLVIQTRLHATKTFAENLVFMLNRTPSTTLAGSRFHFLVLKLLDELFALETTASYFYINDLKVLVDIFLRELSDLPDTSELLRQAYLRVFHALLTQTQLCSISYKRAQVQAVLEMIIGNTHLRDVDERTVLLVQRCLDAEWVVGVEEGIPIVSRVRGGNACAKQLKTMCTERGVFSHAAVADDEAIEHILELGRLQSAAAATATITGAFNCTKSVQWPEPAPETCTTPTSLADSLDLVLLESWDQLRRKSTDSTQSTENRRRAPPRPPRSRTSQPVAEMHMGFVSMPNLSETHSSASLPDRPARRRAPDVPIKKPAPAVVVHEAPPTPTAQASEDRPHSLRDYFRRFTHGHLPHEKYAWEHGALTQVLRFRHAKPVEEAVAHPATLDPPRRTPPPRPPRPALSSSSTDSFCTRTPSPRTSLETHRPAPPPPQAPATRRKAPPPPRP